jgi:hypothetical protein
MLTRLPFEFYDEMPPSSPVDYLEGGGKAFMRVRSSNITRSFWGIVYRPVISGTHVSIPPQAYETGVISAEQQGGNGHQSWVGEM